MKQQVEVELYVGPLLGLAIGNYKFRPERLLGKSFTVVKRLAHVRGIQPGTVLVREAADPVGYLDAPDLARDCDGGREFPAKCVRLALRDLPNGLDGKVPIIRVWRLEDRVVATPALRAGPRKLFI